MSLAFVKVVAPGASPSRWSLVLHGFLGMGRNWEGICKRLVQERPEQGLILPDLRLHGRSQDLRGPHTLEAAAADLIALGGELGVEWSAVLGHSFGGKVALTLFERQPSVRSVWMLDSTPAPIVGETTASQMLAHLRSLPMPMASRAAVVEALVARGVGLGEAQWVASNLEGGPGGMVWRLDFAGLSELLEDFCDADLRAVAEQPSPGREVRVVVAQRSRVVSPEQQVRLSEAHQLHGRTSVHFIDAGHWLHVDNPQALLALWAELL